MNCADQRCKWCLYSFVNIHLKYSFVNFLSIFFFFFFSFQCLYIHRFEWGIVLSSLCHGWDKRGYTKWCSRGSTSTLLNCVWLYLKVIQIQLTWTLSEIQRYYLISHYMALWSSAGTFWKFFENKEPHYQLSFWKFFENKEPHYQLPITFFLWKINYKCYFHYWHPNHCHLFWSHLEKKNW